MATDHLTTDNPPADGLRVEHHTVDSRPVDSHTVDSFAAPVPPEALLEQLTAAAGRAAADAVEITLLGRAGEYTNFAADRIDQPQNITETHFAVRAIVNGHAGRAATGTLAGLDQAVAEAVALATELAGGRESAGHATVAEPGDVPALDLWHQDTAGFDGAERARLAGAAMAAARAAGGSAAGMFGRAVTQLAVVTSTGVARQALATEATGSLTATVGDGTSHWVDLHRAVGALDIEESARRTVREAVAGQRRVPLKDGNYIVVLGPQAVAELLIFLADLGFSGALAAAGLGLVATRAGKPVASRLIHVTDDATAPIGLPFPFDREGTAKRPVPLLSAGVVGSAVTDLATARALGGTSTGHAHLAREQAPSPVPANLVMGTGNESESDLIAGVAHGLYVQRFGYTRLVDRAAGTITGVSQDGCFLIRHGELGQPVQGARFTHSVLAFLSTVDGIADRLASRPMRNVWNGAVSAPAVRGHAFRFGEPKPAR